MNIGAACCISKRNFEMWLLDRNGNGGTRMGRAHGLWIGQKFERLCRPVNANLLPLMIDLT